MSFETIRSRSGDNRFQEMERYLRSQGSLDIDEAIAFMAEGTRRGEEEHAKDYIYDFLCGSAQERGFMTLDKFEEVADVWSDFFQEHFGELVIAVSFDRAVRERFDRLVESHSYLRGDIDFVATDLSKLSLLSDHYQISSLDFITDTISDNELESQLIAYRQEMDLDNEVYDEETEGLDQVAIDIFARPVFNRLKRIHLSFDVSPIITEALTASPNLSGVESIFVPAPYYNPRDKGIHLARFFEGGNLASLKELLLEGSLTNEVAGHLFRNTSLERLGSLSFGIIGKWNVDFSGFEKAHMPRLKEVNLQEGHVGPSLLHALAKNMGIKLEKLDVASGDIDAASLSEYLASDASSKLSNLVVRDNPIGDEGAIALSKRMVSGVYYEDGLWLENCNITDEGFIALITETESKLPDQLGFARNEITDKGIEVLARSDKVRHVKFLDLKHIELSGMGAYTLGQSENLSSLEHLDISDNPIGYSGWINFVDENKLSELRWLIANNAGLTDIALEAFNDSEGLEKIEHLSLSRNEFSFDGLVLFIKKLRTPSLQSLYVSLASFDEQEIEELKELASEKGIELLKGSDLNVN